VIITICTPLFLTGFVPVMIIYFLIQVGYWPSKLTLQKKFIIPSFVICVANCTWHSFGDCSTLFVKWTVPFGHCLKFILNLICSHSLIPVLFLVWCYLC
jgi:hypothetical protein